MFSDMLKAALEGEVVGQSAAVQSVVRGATRVLSGLTPRERKWCAYMFMGPSGTGKTQLVQTLAKTLHGDGKGLYVADCTHYVHADPWMAFVSQLLPMFSVPRVQDSWTVLEAPPLSIILVEYLERGRKEISKALAAALETGRLALPGGKLGSLRNCLLVLTTSLCAREILEENPRIGFQAVPDPGSDTEGGRILQTCRAHAEEHFGEDLIGRLDSLVVFHKLEESHLSEILDRRFARMNRWLTPRGFRCELMPAARGFLLEQGRADPKIGARELVRAHRRYVEFPIADLMVSGRIPARGLVSVDRLGGGKHLHFSVSGDDGAPAVTRDTVLEIPVAWESASPSEAGGGPDPAP